MGLLRIFYMPLSQPSDGNPTSSRRGVFFYLNQRRYHRG
jgi:hypothetical protein